MEKINLRINIVYNVVYNIVKKYIFKSQKPLKRGEGGFKRDIAYKTCKNLNMTFVSQFRVIFPSVHSTGGEYGYEFG